MVLPIIKSREAKEVVVAAKLSKKRLQIEQFFCETRLENRNGLRNVGHRLGMWVTGYELSRRIGDPLSRVYDYVEVGINILVSLFRVEFHSLGLGVSISPFVALVSVELHS